MIISTSNDKHDTNTHNDNKVMDLVLEVEGSMKSPEDWIEQESLFAAASEASAMDICRDRVLEAIEQQRREAQQITQ